MSLLKGECAIITGGAGGIGSQVARRFLEEGASVAIVDANEELVHSVANEIGATPIVADVTDGDSLITGFDRAAEELGGLSILVNNAGTSNMSRLHEWDPAEWRRLIDINLTGVYLGFRAGIVHLEKNGGGSIVNTASISGTRPAAGEVPYAAAKAGVAALTAAAALEYGPHIRVNAVSPGMIRTAMTDPLLEIFPHEAARYEATTPIGRMGEPGDVADVIVFLVSPLARFVTGQNIVVDGGMTLHGSAVDGIFDQVFRPPSTAS